MKIVTNSVLILLLVTTFMGCANKWFIWDSTNKGTVHWNRQEEKKEKGYLKYQDIQGITHKMYLSTCQQRGVAIIEGYCEIHKKYEKLILAPESWMEKFYEEEIKNDG